MVQQGKSWPLLHGLPDAVVSFAGFVLETAMIDSLLSGALHEQVQNLLYTAEQVSAMCRSGCGFVVVFG